jgi:TolB-like protein/tetratricopeptide (TPR) repeat protein
MTVRRPPAWQALLADLKRRRVFRVMAVYGVVGFVVLQAADLLVPVLLLPDWTYRFIGLVLLAGFPIAVALAWVFDFTADGVRRTEPLGGEELAEIIARPRRQRWPAGMLALVGTLLLFGGAWYAIGAGSATPEDARAGDATRASSLAVLPFTNLARTPDTEPFVDGVHDDLLTQLSRIGALRVISRTSVQGYRETTKNIRTVAAELGVDFVLEGGVQRAGDEVRINVQLIDARTDEHVWAETYNRTLTVANVFAIQSEIAGAIAAAMHAQLTPEQQRMIAARPTESLDAYDRYQRGLAFFRRTLVGTDVRQAIGELEAAVRIDPAFADAWAWLAIARLTLAWDFGVTHEAAAAEAAIRRVEALAPGRMMTHVARGYYHYYGRREYDAALAAFARAAALSPDDPTVLLPTGWTLRRMGRWDDALEQYRAAFQRDPRNWDNVLASMAESHLTLRRYADAERSAELAISIAPELAAGYSHLAMVRLLADGDTAGAAQAIERGARRTDLARIVFDFPALSRVLAAQFGERLRDVTSTSATDTASLLTQWLGQELTPAAFFLQKAQLLRALGDDAAARAHFDSARAVLEPRAARVPADVIWSQQSALQSGLGVAYAALGRKQDAIRNGREALDAVLRVGDAFIAPVRRADLAEIYVVTGEHELALDELERLLGEPSRVSAALLRVDPIWTPLHGHPRFQRLVGGAR